MINIENVHLSFIRDGVTTQVLDGISFSVPARTSCAIIGPSGCGKTSLLFLLAGLIQPDKGEVKIEGSPRCGTILQHYGLFPWKTVYQNICLGPQLAKEKKDSTVQQVSNLIEEMGLAGFEHHYPAELSGGMQQRVAMARALALRPDILLMDEPLSSLDALTRERLQNLILDVWQKNRITKVLVTHSIEEAVFLGQKIIILDSRPARVLEIIDNQSAGDPEYRKIDIFFNRCTSIRNILGGVNGQEA